MEAIRTFQPLVRVYFNRGGDATKAWSIDFGPGTPEINILQVIIQAPCSTQLGLDNFGSKTAAAAWIELNEVLVCISDYVIFIEPMKERPAQA